MGQYIGDALNQTGLSRSKMLKHAQTILAKYRGRAISTVKDSWEEHQLGLCGAFVGGYFVYICECIYKRRKNRDRVDRMSEEYGKRMGDMFDRAAQYRHRSMVEKHDKWMATFAKENDE